MPVCTYIYCRARFDEAEENCPECGYPRDRSALSDPQFSDSVIVDGLPPELLDMHQILPAMDGVLELQLRAMERFGIRKVLLQSAPDEARSLLGNRDLLGLAADHPDRFWVSQFVDPRMPGVLDELQRIASRGVKVVKLIPAAGYRPDDPAHDSFWQSLQDLGLVAMIHTGFITARHKQEEASAGVFLSSTFSDPLFLDQPARKFPRLAFILCHLGGAIWCEAGAQMVSQHDNVWGDVSGFGLFALRRILSNGAAVDWSKLFWGNDSPPFAYPHNLRLHLAALRRASAEALAPQLLFENGHRFSERFLS